MFYLICSRQLKDIMKTFLIIIAVAFGINSARCNYGIGLERSTIL